MPSRRCDTDRSRRVRRSMSAADGMPSARPPAPAKPSRGPRKHAVEHPRRSGSRPAPRRSSRVPPRPGARSARGSLRPRRSRAAGYPKTAANDLPNPQLEREGVLLNARQCLTAYSEGYGSSATRRPAGVFRTSGRTPEHADGSQLQTKIPASSVPGRTAASASLPRLTTVGPWRSWVGEERSDHG
jgi:hypothetical protein